MSDVVAPSTCGLRERREARGLTQGRFISVLLDRGVELGVPLPKRESLRVEVSGWENDKHSPNPEHARLCADVLGCATADIWPKLAAGHLMALPPPAALAEHFQGLLAGFTTADHHLGAAYLLDPAKAAFRTLESCFDNVERHRRGDCMKLAARYGELIGWLYQDLGRLGEARTWTVRALDLAEAVADRHLISYTVMRRSGIETDAGRASEALILAERALRDSVTPRGRALALRQVAAAHALHGNCRGFAEAVEQGLESAGSDDTEDFEITVYCTVPYMHMEAGGAAIVLGEYGKAIDHLDRALRAWPGDQVRDRAVCTGRLVLAYALAGEANQAANVGPQAIEAFLGAPSHRAASALRRARLALPRSASDPEVVEFRQAVLALMS